MNRFVVLCILLSACASQERRPDQPAYLAKANLDMNGPFGFEMLTTSNPKVAEVLVVSEGRVHSMVQIVQYPDNGMIVKVGAFSNDGWDAFKYYYFDSKFQACPRRNNREDNEYKTKAFFALEDRRRKAASEAGCPEGYGLRIHRLEE